MLEYFSYKKYKANKAAASGSTATPPPTTTPTTATTLPQQKLEPLLSPHDERFLANVINSASVSADDGEEHIIFGGGVGHAVTPPDVETPPLMAQEDVEREKERKLEEEIEKLALGMELPSSPPLAATNIATTSAAATTTATGKEAEKADEKWIDEIKSKWGHLSRSISETRLNKLGGVDMKGVGVSVGGLKSRILRRKEKEETGAEKEGEAQVEGSPKVEKDIGEEINREGEELSEILDTLNLAAQNGKLFTPTTDLQALLRKFTLILRDLHHGVPTAYSDLTNFLETSSSTLQSTFSSLPSFLQNLIKTSTAPSSLMNTSLLRTLAATSPALTELAGPSGATNLLKALAAKPGLITELLKDAVTLLRTRFPMLLGGSVAVSLGMFVLLYILWYCYKRGKEEREEQEERERMEAFGVERIESEEQLKRREKEEQGKGKGKE